MPKNDIEKFKLLYELGKPIFDTSKNGNEAKILKTLAISNNESGDSPNSSPLNLKLIYLLLNNETITSKLFWKTFIALHSGNIDKNYPFTISDISKLIELVSKNNEKENNETSNALYNNLKFFISTNALIKNASKTHITSEESFKSYDTTAIAYTNITKEYSEQLIETYQKIILNAILLIKGFQPSTDILLDKYMDAAYSPSEDNLTILKKHGLTKEASSDATDRYNALMNLDKQDPITTKYSDYIRQASLTIIDLKTLLIIFENAKTGASEHFDYNLTERLEFNTVLDMNVFDYSKGKHHTFRTFLNEYTDGELDISFATMARHKKESQKGSAKIYLEKSYIFEDQEEIEFTIDTMIDPCSIVINAINYLIKSIEARIIVSTSVDGEISAQKLALISQLDTYRTVANDARIDNTPLHKEFIHIKNKNLKFKDFKFSAKTSREWLKHKNRRNPYEEKPSNVFFDQITIEEIKDIYNALS